MQELVRAGLTDVRARLSSAPTAEQLAAAISCLADAARHATDASVPQILQTIAVLLPQYLAAVPPRGHAAATQRPNATTAQLLERGQPFLSIMQRAPNLAAVLHDPLTLLLSAAANSALPADAASAITAHLHPFMVAALAAPAPLGPQTVAALERAAAARPLLQPAVMRSLHTHLRLVARCPPSPLPPAAYGATWALTDAVIAYAHASRQGKRATPGSVSSELQPEIRIMSVPSAEHILPLLTELALQLHDEGRPLAWVVASISAIVATLTTAHTARATAATLARAAASRPFTGVEASLLRLTLDLEPSANIDGHVPAELQLLRAQLLQHASVSADTDLHQVALRLLQLTSTATEQRPDPGSVQEREPSDGFGGNPIEAYTTAVLAAQLQSNSSERVIHWLRQVAASAQVSLAPKQRVRAAAVIDAMRCGACWPTPVDANLLADDEHADDVVDTGQQSAFSIAADAIALLTLLCNHEQLSVRRNAAATLAVVALAAPDASAVLIPWAIGQINDAITSASSGNTDEVESECLLLPLALLPVLCASPFLEQPLFAVASGLLSSTASLHVRALGIRLLLAFWQAHGRGWTALSRAIAAYGPARGRAASDAPVDVILRRAAGAAVAAVARAAPERCVELVAMIGGMLDDGDEAVAAVALEAIFWLCYYVRLFAACHLHRCAAAPLRRCQRCRPANMVPHDL